VQSPGVMPRRATDQPGADPVASTTDGKSAPVRAIIDWLRLARLRGLAGVT